MWTPAESSTVAGISAPVGHACTHSPQATQVLWPIGSPKSKTILEPMPRPAMPMTSLTWTSRQARTQRLQWMQASRLTAIAGWLLSGGGGRRAGNRLAASPASSIQRHSSEPGSWATVFSGWSASKSSSTIRRAVAARSDWVITFIPATGLRRHDGASTRSPSISTMQARQLPSGR